MAVIIFGGKGTAISIWSTAIATGTTTGVGIAAILAVAIRAIITAVIIYKVSKSNSNTRKCNGVVHTVQQELSQEYLQNKQKFMDELPQPEVIQVQEIIQITNQSCLIC